MKIINFCSTILLTLALTAVTQARVGETLPSATGRTNSDQSHFFEDRLPEATRDLSSGEAGQGATTTNVAISSCAQKAFDDLMTELKGFKGQISTDEDEWNAYIAIGSSSTTVGDYAIQVITTLWTNGLDQDSWTDVRSAASRALNFMLSGDSDQAVLEVLTGFDSISSPSHNNQFWNKLKLAGHSYITCPEGQSCRFACA